jgi:hypothetical protein
MALEKNNFVDIRLVIEMVLWGGNQRGILNRFLTGFQSVDEYNRLMRELVIVLDYPEQACKVSLSIPGFGLTYASKLLRFCAPSNYGALDSRIRKTLKDIPSIRDGNFPSMQNGYLTFLNLIHELQSALGEQGIKRPRYGKRESSTHWRSSEVEMALFAWASR